MLTWLKSKVIYENRLGKFKSDLYPFLRFCQIFGCFPVIDLSKGSEKKERKFVWWIFLTRILRFVCVIITSNLLFNARSTFTNREIFLRVQSIVCYTLSEIVSIFTGNELFELTKTVNEFDNHAKTLQTKSKLMKIKYERYFWVVLGLLQGLFAFGCLIIYCFFGYVNRGITCLSTLVFFSLVVTFLVTNLLMIVVLFHEIICRINLLENSFFKIYNELIISRSNAVLIKLHIDKYRDVHRKILSIVKNLKLHIKWNLFMSKFWLFQRFLYWFWMLHEGLLDNRMKMIIVHETLLIFSVCYSATRANNTVSKIEVY